MTTNRKLLWGGLGLLVLILVWSESDITMLTGPVADQAALRGLLSKIWDLNLVLISATRIEVDSK